SPTVAEPVVRRSIIPRRIGSERAPKTSSSDPVVGAICAVIFLTRAGACIPKGSLSLVGADGAVARSPGDRGRAISRRAAGRNVRGSVGTRTSVASGFGGSLAVVLV